MLSPLGFFPMSFLRSCAGTTSRCTDISVRMQDGSMLLLGKGRMTRVTRQWAIILPEFRELYGMAVWRISEMPKASIMDVSMT